jgi:hypothetical protein
MQKRVCFIQIRLYPCTTPLNAKLRESFNGTFYTSEALQTQQFRLLHVGCIGLDHWQ